MQRTLVRASLAVFALSVLGCGLDVARQQQMAAQMAAEDAMVHKKLAEESAAGALESQRAELDARDKLQAAQEDLKAAQEELEQVKAELEQAKTELAKLKAKPETGTP